MEEIKLNLENLNQKEREQLMALVRKANKFSLGRWKPEIGEPYWFFNSDKNDCHVTSRKRIENDPQDYYNILIGNCFKTEKEVLFALEKQKIKVELQDFADNGNEGWKPNWNDINEEKYFLMYDYNIKDIRCSCNGVFKTNSIYFRSKYEAERAITIIGEERLKKYYFEV